MLRADGVTSAQTDGRGTENKAKGGSDTLKKNRKIASMEFEHHFPTLSQTLEKLEEITDLAAVQLNLKFASDEELSAGTRSFFTKQMGTVIAAVDDELVAVLGKSWSQLKAQSKGMIAVHTILVLWRATKLPAFEKLSDKE